MTKELFLADLLTVSEIGQILVVFKENRKWNVTKTHNALSDFASEVEAQVCSKRELQETMQDRSAGTKGDPPKLNRDKISLILRFLGEQATPEDWSRLHNRNPALARRLTAPSLNLSNAMSNWLGNFAQNPPELEQRSDENGRFLIFRLDRAGGIISSFMKIESASVSLPLPRFSTSRIDDSGARREVEGIIILSNGLFYSFGKAGLHGGFRATILKPLNRSDAQQNDRFDMFGARLGQQDSPELPYAYPIYCYQIKRDRSKEELAKLTGKIPENDPFLTEQIDDLPNILTRLRRAAEDGFGVFADPSS